MKQKLYIYILLLTLPTPAFAYLDPGTGSMLLSAIVGLVATALFSIKSFYYKLTSLFYRLIGKKVEKTSSKLVFYSEGGHYWKTFKPVLEALDQLKVQAEYLTSDEADAGLKFESDYITSRFIGEGNRAYTYLNLLEADVCAMTTPGLDVLQIRRSKGVKHYAHLVHAPTDMGLYKLYSFDYYDSIFCSGEHQKKSIREFERLRNTPEKLLLDSGCPYMDVSAQRLEANKAANHTPTNKVLLAPTWGTNGLLTRFGGEVIRQLLATGMQVVIRPHPQSYVSEQELMQQLEKDFANEPRVSWDKSPDNFQSLLDADILVSDLSGVVFDFAFIFEKPVVTVEFAYNWQGMEANDLPYKLWELEALDQLGKCLKEDEIPLLAETVKQLANNPATATNLQELRNNSLFNYRNTGAVIAQQLIDLMEEVNATA